MMQIYRLVRVISYDDWNIAYLQYGLIYKEIPLEEYIKHEEEHLACL